MNGRPITALCIGGPKHNEMLTYPSDWRPVVKVMPDPEPLAWSVNSDPFMPMPRSIDYDTEMVWYPMGDVVLLVHVLVHDRDVRLRQALEGLAITMMMMLMGRGWVGMDEGQRWIVEKRR